LSERLTKVDFTNLEKTLYPKVKITKAQVIEYYIKVAPKMLHLLADRPMVLTRYPDGVEKQGFYEKDKPKGTPSWVKTVKIYSETAKRDVKYGIQTARLLKEKLDQLGLQSYVKTSGKKGLHIVIPIQRDYPYRVTREFAHVIGQYLARETDIVVSEFSETKKPNKVFIDYTQNSHGKTMVIPYGLRATSDATVSTPLEWTEVKKGLKPETLNLFSVVKRKKDPWEKELPKPLLRKKLNRNR